MHPIIALWSHPRSMSTAMERIMRERGDLKCFHEPFMYDYYINRKVRVMPHFKPETGRPVTFAQVRDMLLEHAQSGVVFFKDMSYYVMPHLLDDTQLRNRLINCFLIRNPLASIASYFKLDSEVTSEEIGLEAQFLHYDALRNSSKTQPVVIEAEKIRENAARTINALWDEIGLPRADHAFQWGTKNPEDWSQVAGWHSDVSSSQRIWPMTSGQSDAEAMNFEKLSRQFPRMLEYLDHHLPFYEALKSQAIKL